MHGRHPNAPPSRARRDLDASPGRAVTMAVVLAAAVAGGAVLLLGGDGSTSSSPTDAARNAPVAAAAAPLTTAAAPAARPAGGEGAADEPGAGGDVGDGGDTVGADAVAVDVEGCLIDVVSVSQGDEGDSVECAQQALRAAGFYDGPITGVFDDATDAATRRFQDTLGLYVDGIVGARTAEPLGIWPGAESFIVRTPEPPPGATDLWGYPLSSVASAGDDAPPMPPDSGQGTGKRVVYDRAGQRVWAVDDEERVVRSYLVSGSQYRNEQPGVHTVYSRSEMSTAWNFQADLPLMIRYQKTDRGHIGFHAIPLHKSDGSAYQTEAELGHKLSGGCQRQANRDAEFLWAFAEVGTRVIVV